MDNFIKSAKKGTVLMSLGTNMKSNMLGEARLKVIIETFAQFPDFNFLWKFESEVKDLPLKPSKNVMIEKFLPQNDILAHPGLKAFISHAGMLSTHEALWHGKPVIGMPFFVDQHRNLEKLVSVDVATKVEFRDLSVESFKTAISTVVNDPKYFKNAQKISKLFKDKPNRPLDVATWWIEYAIRNPNLDNLKSPTLKLGPFVSKSYDVLFVVVALVHVVLYLLLKTVRFVLKSRGDKRKVE
jgi:glucuronosyltransferase